MSTDKTLSEDVAFWQTMTVAWLHDPPDKALDIRGHVGRAVDNIEAALGDLAGGRDRLDQEAKKADILASSIERLPTPDAKGSGPDVDAVRVGPEDGRLSVVHPLAGSADEITVPEIDPAAIRYRIGEIAYKVPRRGNTAEDCFLRVWRQLPGAFAGLDRLPADTRIPDHTLWNHLDLTAAWQAVDARGGKPALLSFAIGSPQRFIEASRSLRDLWVSSYLMSWLTFQAMLPVIQRLGPTAFIYPSLRGSPLMDDHLSKGAMSGVDFERGRQTTPALPNRFLALVPAGDSLDWRQTIVTAAQEAWHDVAEKVREALAPRLEGFDANWDARWDAQIAATHEFRATLVPLDDLDDSRLAGLKGAKCLAAIYPAIKTVETLAKLAGRQTDRPGSWQAAIDHSAAVMAAERQVRKVPTGTAGEGPWPLKCALFGSFEQMGPARTDDSRKFWEQAAAMGSVAKARLRKADRFSAPALVKRFAWGAFLSDEVRAGAPRQPDTATLAAIEWLGEAGLDWQSFRDWNGQWLHRDRQTEGEDDDDRVPDDVWAAIEAARKAQREKKSRARPPAYYAILMMDGDEMGKWLSGEKGPALGHVMHGKLKRFYDTKQGGKQPLEWDDPRPLTPFHHAALSSALANFSARVAPLVVEQHHGALIYAGGDDVLALLPIRQALCCARALERAFRGEPGYNGGAPEGYYRIDGRDLLMMGPTATVSAGLAVVHYKEDLRLALQEARKAEKQAKDKGRNRLVIQAMRRSGEHAPSTLPWHLVEAVDELVRQFADGASDRWAYRLRALAPTLGAIPDPAAWRSELKRQIARNEEQERQAVGQLATVPSLFDRWQAKDHGGFEDFVILCQTASFLARGEDDER